MAYRHRETGEYYDGCRYSNYNGKITREFEPWNKSLKTIKLECNWVYNTDLPEYNKNTDESIKKYRDADKANDAVMDKLVNETFEVVDLKPVISISDKPKYVKVIVDMKCPICGAPLETYGGVYLTYPAQRDHKCTNPNCNYHTCLSRWYAGQELLAESKEDAYRIITSGTKEEQEALADRRERR